MIDSLVLEWPLGLKEAYTALDANHFYAFQEGNATGIVRIAQPLIPLRAFPNPAMASVQIDIPQDSQIRSAVLFNTDGLMLRQIDVPSGADHIDLSLIPLTAGIYWVKVVSVDGKNGVVRLVKL